MTDFDECQDSLFYTDCHINASCINAIGSYLCVCNSGHLETNYDTEYKGRICKGILRHTYTLGFTHLGALKQKQTWGP